MKIAIVDCNCMGSDPNCKFCKGHEKLEVTQTNQLHDMLDLATLKFDPIPGLFRVFFTKHAIIGTGNIEYQPELHSYFIYEIQSYFGAEGHTLMLETMLAQDDIHQVEGSFDFKDCLIS